MHGAVGKISPLTDTPDTNGTSKGGRRASPSLYLALGFAAWTYVHVPWMRGAAGMRIRAPRIGPGMGSVS